MDEQDAESIVEKVVETTEEEHEVEEKGDSVPWTYILLFYFLGTAAFVPHNFYITANEYWMYKFRDPNLPFNGSENVAKTNLQKNFTAFVGIAGNIGMIAFLFLTFLLQKNISLQKRIVGCITLLLGLLALTLIFIHIDTDLWQATFYRTSLLIGALLNGCSATLLVSLFQLASKFPPRCLVAQMAGQNICGILAALVQIIALALAPSVKGTATLYFAVATISVAAIMVTYIVVVSRSDEFKKRLNEKPKVVKKKTTKAELELAMVMRVFRKLALLIVSLILSVGISGILHPGLTALIESSNKGKSTWSDVYFLPVTVFLCFHLFEFIAREASNHIEKLKNIYYIFGTSVVRLVLFPLILFCNIQPRNHLPVVFQDDAYFIIFMILLSLSGGYLANISILVISKYCEPEERMIGTAIIIMILIIFIPLVSILSGMVVNLI